MTFELWLFTIKHLGQTCDATVTIFNALLADEQEALRREHENLQTADRMGRG